MEELPKEKQEEVKRVIIENRLRRNVYQILAKIELALAPIKNFFKKLYQDIGAWARKIEEEYQEKQRELLKKDTRLTEGKIKELLDKAHNLAEKNNLGEAENTLVEVISLDAKNIEAYRLLGQIYFKQKNYIHAEEIWHHLEKIMGAQDELILINLGMLAKVKGDNDQAYKYFREALRFTPSDPKLLDLLIEISIILKKKYLAERYLKRLRKVNSENQKLSEFEERIGRI